MRQYSPVIASARHAALKKSTATGDRPRTVSCVCRRSGLRRRRVSLKSILKRMDLAQPAAGALEECRHGVRLGEHGQRENPEFGH